MKTFLSKLLRFLVFGLMMLTIVGCEEEEGNKVVSDILGTWKLEKINNVDVPLSTEYERTDYFVTFRSDGICLETKTTNSSYVIEGERLSFVGDANISYSYSIDGNKLSFGNPEGYSRATSYIDGVAYFTLEMLFSKDGISIRSNVEDKESSVVITVSNSSDKIEYVMTDVDGKKTTGTGTKNPDGSVTIVKKESDGTTTTETYGKDNLQSTCTYEINGDQLTIKDNEGESTIRERVYIRQ